MNKQPRVIDVDELLKEIEENRQIANSKYFKSDDEWSGFYDGEANGLIIAKEIIEDLLQKTAPISLPTSSSMLEQIKERIEESAVDGDDMGLTLNDISNVILRWKNDRE